VATEYVDTAIVAERDAWICHVCGLSIDPAAKYPDPMSRSIDHVIPLVHGGAHSYQNVKLAHLICNVRKGAK